MNGAGTGIAAATAIRVPAANPQLQAPVTVFRCTPAGCVSEPIVLTADAAVYVTFYGTGIRGRSALSRVSVAINGVSVPVLYADVSPNYDGLDQVNVVLRPALRGSGEADVVLTAGGQDSNVAKINIQ